MPQFDLRVRDSNDRLGGRCGSGQAVEQAVTTPSLASAGATTFGAPGEQTSFDSKYAMADVSSSSHQLFAYATIQFP